MQIKLLDKHTIVNWWPAQSKPAMVLAMLLWLAACASTDVDQSRGGEGDNQAPDQLEVAEEVSAERSELQADLIFHMLAAERLGASGDQSEALSHYLDAAMLSDDPSVARQVVALAMQAQDWDALVAGSGRWLELEPDQPQAGQLHTLALVNTGQVDAAAERLAGVAADADSETEGLRSAVMLLAAAEDADDALATLDRVLVLLEREPDSPGALHARSSLHWQLEQSDRALELARAAVRDSGERRALVWAAQLAAAEDELEEALGYYRRARADHPEDIELGLAEVEVLRQLERREEAIEELAGMPPNTEVLYTLGSYLNQAGDAERAEETWEALAELETVDDPVHHAFLTGFLAEQIGRDSAALEWYEQVESGPNAERALLRRAIIEGDAGNLLVARNLLRSVRLAGDRGLVRQSLLIEAELLRTADRADEAVELLSEALREHPNSIELLYARALSAVSLDDIELAEQDFRRILQIESDNSMALNALGYTLADRTSRYQEAYRLIRRAYELEPDEPAIIDSMGWVYYRLGQKEEALEYLQRAHEGEDNPEIAAHLGEVLWKLGREDEAREVFETARERHPDDNYLVETLERLGVQ